MHGNCVPGVATIVTKRLWVCVLYNCIFVLGWLYVLKPNYAISIRTPEMTPIVYFQNATAMVQEQSIKIVPPCSPRKIALISRMILILHE